MPKKSRAARKKKKNKNMKASVFNPLAEKVVAEAKAVFEMVTSQSEANESSESVLTEVNEGGDVGESSYHDPATIANPGEKFSHDPTAMANSILDCVVNGDETSLESALEGLSLRQPAHPLHEHLNERTTIPPAGAEKIAPDVKLSEIVAYNVVMSGSVSNVYESDIIAVGGDVNAQPVSEMSSNEIKGNESSKSADNQNTFQEVLDEASSNKERNKTCESAVKSQESLIKTSKKAERNVNFLQEYSLIKSASNETEGNEGGNVGKSSYDPTTVPNLVESDVADSDQISPQSALKGVSITPSSTILSAEKKVAAGVEGVSTASEYNVGDVHADAVPEMCLSKNDGSKSNKSVSQKLLIKTNSNAVETNESSESAITAESVLEETLVETTSKIAEAYDLSKFVEGKSVTEEPSVELPRRPERNKKQLWWAKDYYMSPQVKHKRK